MARFHDRYRVEGTLTINGHCTFKWTEDTFGYQRNAMLEPQHCAQCTAEVRRMGILLDEPRPPDETVKR